VTAIVIEMYGVPAGCKKYLLGVAVERYLARIRNGITFGFGLQRNSAYSRIIWDRTGEFNWPVDILRDPLKISNLPGRQGRRLPVQIPISVAQDWLSGGDSSGANVDRSKLPGRVLH
jgi:hypothetical protein